ncbi:MAG: hypothetical protein QNL40_01175 [Flavobacteriales bacterium]
MKRFKQIIRPDALAFVLFAGLVWLVMTITGTTSTKSCSVNVVAESSLVEGYYLLDTLVPLMIDVESSGINALRLGQFEDVLVVVEKELFFVDKSGQLTIRSEDIKALLSQEYGNEYSFTITTSSVIFPSEQLSSVSVPVVIKGIRNATLPSGMRWSEALRIEPDTVVLTGPIARLQRTQVFVTIPEVIWEGRMAISLPLDPLEKGLELSVNSVDVIGTSEYWVEKEFIYQRRIGQRVYEVKLWFSGPFSILKNSELIDLCELTFKDFDTFEMAQVTIRNKGVELLSITPHKLEKPLQ